MHGPPEILGEANLCEDQRDFLFRVVRLPSDGLFQALCFPIGRHYLVIDVVFGCLPRGQQPDLYGCDARLSDIQLSQISFPSVRDRLRHRRWA